MTDFNRVWLTSDHHFFHDNIVKYCNRPVNHNELMIERYRETVKDGDLVIWGGDIAFGLWKLQNPEQTLRELIKSLPGNKILLRGNHDEYSDEFYISCGFLQVRDFMTIPDHKIFLSHYPNERAWSEKYPQHNQMLLRMADYNDWHFVHGHTHGRIVEDQTNMCVDANDFRPISLQSIINRLKI